MPLRLLWAFMAYSRVNFTFYRLSQGSSYVRNILSQQRRKMQVASRRLTSFMPNYMTSHPHKTVILIAP